MKKSLKSKFITRNNAILRFACQFSAAEAIGASLKVAQHESIWIHLTFNFIAKFESFKLMPRDVTTLHAVPLTN